MVDILQHVKLKPGDTPLTYALRRVGIYHNLVDIPTINTLSMFFDKHKFRVEDLPGVGAIVVWENGAKVMSVPNEISPTREIYSNREQGGIRIGVIEDEYCSKVSDCALNPQGIYEIRLGKLNEQVLYPDYVISIKQEYLNQPAGLRFIDKIFKSKNRKS